MRFLAYHLVISFISTLATEKITASQAFSMELIFVTQILWLIPSILDELLDPFTIYQILKKLCQNMMTLSDVLIRPSLRTLS